MGRALVIVDFQNDFTPGGALEVPEGDQIAPRLNALAHSGTYDLVIATRDWHPADHGSFAERGGSWPVHCVRDTPGAQLHPALDAQAIDVVLDKGRDPGTEGDSGFVDTDLEELLRSNGIKELTVVGLPTDRGVKHTALDALRAGFAVRIDPEAVRGMEVEPGDTERALDELRAAGATVA